MIPLVATIFIYIFILITIHNFKMAGIIYLLSRFFLLENFYFLNIESLPLITVNRVLLLILFVTFLIKINSSPQLYISFKSYPLNNFFILFFISLLLSVFTAINSVSSNFNYFLGIVLEQFFIFYIVMFSFETTVEVEKFISKIFIAIFFICIYGIYTYVSNSNPFIDFFRNYGNNRVNNLIFDYGNETRAGIMGRIQSVFFHPIAYGAILSMVSPLVLNRILHNKNLVVKLSLSFLFLLIIINIFLTNSRSPILFFMISNFAFILLLNRNKIFTKSTFGLVILYSLFIIFYSLFPNYTNLFFSAIYFYDDVRGQALGGSSFEGRLLQISLAYELFLKHPILGHGLTYIRELVLQKKTFALLGAESFLIKLLINLGIVGFFSYTSLFIKLIVELIKGEKKFLIKNSYLINAILSIIPGYIAFIIATGDLDTFPFFFIFIALGIQIILLSKTNLYEK